MNSIHPGTRVGHVHLKVADLERTIGFYSGVLGFGITQRYEAQAAFLAAGGYHHHIGLNTWESAAGTPAPSGHTGLHHTAFLFPDRKALAQVFKWLVAARWPIDGAADHGVGETIYLTDPDGNGVELYVDRPESEWPRDADGTLAMVNKRFDLAALLAEAA